MYKALIFDLDGVLIHSEKPTFFLLQDILKRRGYILEDKEIARRTGKKILPFIDEIFGSKIPEATKTDVLREFTELYVGNIEKYTEPILETVNFVKAHKTKVRLALATMSFRVELAKILPAIGLDKSFDAIVTADDVNNAKPHPEVYLKVLKQLKLPASAAAAIEDSPVGVESAYRAGLSVYVLLNGLNRKAHFNKRHVSGFKKSQFDLEALLNPKQR